MKKRMALILASILLFSLTGCNETVSLPDNTEAVTLAPDTETIIDPIVFDNEKYWLILPISKKRLRVADDYVRYLNMVDAELLRRAEEKINDEVSPYPHDAPAFYLSLDNEGYFCLSAEVIVTFDPPQTEVDGEHIIMIDHDHLFFSERITKTRFLETTI